MDRPKGRLCRRKPYKVTTSGLRGKGIALSVLTSAKLEDLYYEEEMDNGIILLIPKDLYENNN